MSNPENGLIYLYPGLPSSSAALHILDHTALASVTERSHTFYAGAPAIKVELTTPRPSTGEYFLWESVRSIGLECDGLDVHGCAQYLDPTSLRVLWEALGIRWALAEEATA